jgi:hypothetical protein
MTGGTRKEKRRRRRMTKTNTNWCIAVTPGKIIK